MTIPVQWYDEDFYICRTIEDAIEALSPPQQSGEVCPNCHGYGFTNGLPIAPGALPLSSDCLECNGTGQDIIITDPDDNDSDVTSPPDKVGVSREGS